MIVKKKTCKNVSTKFLLRISKVCFVMTYLTLRVLMLIPIHQQLTGAEECVSLHYELSLFQEIV